MVESAFKFTLGGRGKIPPDLEARLLSFTCNARTLRLSNFKPLNLSILRRRNDHDLLDVSNACHYTFLTFFTLVIYVFTG